MTNVLWRINSVIIPQVTVVRNVTDKEDSSYVVEIVTSNSTLSGYYSLEVSNRVSSDSSTFDASGKFFFASFSLLSLSPPPPLIKAVKYLCNLVLNNHYLAGLMSDLGPAIS